MKYIIFIVLFSPLFVGAQSFKQYVKAADRSFKEGNYASAISLYKNALRINSDVVTVIYNCAEANRLNYSYAEAERYYKKILTQSASAFPLAQFWYADMLKCQGKYQKAQQQFLQYYQQHMADNDFYSQKARHEIYSCEKAMLMMFSIKPVQIEHFDTLINSDYSEFNVYEKGDSLMFFSSYRPENDSLKKDFLSKIYLTHKPDSLWEKAVAADTSLNIKVEDMANLTFSADEKKAFFTRCKTIKKNRVCRIYSANHNNGLFSDIKELPQSINMSGTNNTQPFYANTPDGIALLFVSDRPGGQGKNDIWFSRVDKDGNYGDPENIGSKINSPDDEITPYYNNEDSLLYFSSRWHENLGGFDIFTTKGDFYYWDTIKNLGYPINSTYNDLYYAHNTEHSKAYFSSNREGAYYATNDHCCNDIFYYALPHKKKDSVLVKEEVKITDVVMKEMKLLVPITLFFHNDEPNPRTTDTTTKFNYKNLYETYIGMLDEYKTAYSFGLKGEEKNEAAEDIDKFFSNEIELGFNALETFAQRLEVLLKEGENVVITLKGYTSPLNTTEYNKKLAKRRISSLMNYFREYDNGFFSTYMQHSKTDGNYLIFEQVAIGEEHTGKNVSDDLNDKRNSVYSPAAAFERKIQIIAVSVPD